MFDVVRKMIFSIDNDFIVSRLVASLYLKGLDVSEVQTYEPKRQSLIDFYENLFTAPLVGKYRLGIISETEERDNEYYENIINKLPEFSYLLFKFTRVPLRSTKFMKERIQFRLQLDEAECDNLLNTHLALTGKKVSANAKKFLVSHLISDASKTIQTLDKIIALTSSLYLDENKIKASFEDNLSKFQIPEAFFKSKGLDCIKILEQVDFSAFKGLYFSYLQNLIKFKIAESKPASEKFRLLKAHPDVINAFARTVSNYTLIELERRFVYFSFISKFDKEIFIIKHLAYK